MTAYPHVDVPQARASLLKRVDDRVDTLGDGLNGRRHRKVVMLFMVVVLAHWAEHLFQAAQVYVLGWARPDSQGALGELWPWLISSEWLHYAYAIVMLVGLVLLRHGFSGTARSWWKAALILQLWHHFEHLLLLGQALTHQTLFGAAKPTSVVQVIIARVELHLFYNVLVFIPMIIAVYLQFWAPRAQSARKKQLAQRA